MSRRGNTSSRYSSNLFLGFLLCGCAFLGSNAHRGEALAQEAPAVTPERGRAKMNCILISLDTVRADHLSCYGYARNTSPNLDRFAREGCLFTHAFAASSWTIPSHASIFTSLYPSSHLLQTADDRLIEGAVTLAEVLQAHDYSTAAFVTGPALSHEFGFGRGFGLYDDFTVTMSQEVGDLSDDVAGERLNQIPTNHFITTLASNWLADRGDAPFFLFLHYWDVHSDYVAPPPFDRQFDTEYLGDEDGRHLAKRREQLESTLAQRDLEHLVALYDEEIAHTDAHLGAILRVLDKMDMAGRTLVVVTSDHGEGFLEHGKLLHGNTLYDELIHVPLIFRMPGRLSANRRIDGNVSHVDIMPTILGLLGLPGPMHIQGKDLTAVLQNGARIPDRVVYSEVRLTEALRCAADRGFKAITDLRSRESRLFRMSPTPDEPVDVASLPEAERTAAGIVVSAADDGPQTGMERADNKQQEQGMTNEEIKKRLRSLGYM
jgi:arylsulfatase A-like enzyme